MHLGILTVIAFILGVTFKYLSPVAGITCSLPLLGLLSFPLSVRFYDLAPGQQKDSLASQV